MKKRKVYLLVLLVTVLLLVLCSCSDETGNNAIFQNPGDKLGGAGTVTTESSNISTTDYENSVKEQVESVDFSSCINNIDSTNATVIESSEEKVSITLAGDYFLSGNYAAGIEVSVENGGVTHLFLNGATISNDNGIAITNSNKKSDLIITCIAGTENTITNAGDDVNAIHVKGNLTINGTGELIIASSSKGCIKATKTLTIVSSKLTLTSAGNAVAARTISVLEAKIEVSNSQKDGIQAECDDDTIEFTLKEGYVYLKNVEYKYVGLGDGIQADTFVYIDGGNYNISTTGTFVTNTQENCSLYDLESDDFRYIASGSSYKKVASDYRGTGTMYALAQSCKGIKVGEIKYDSDGDDIDDVIVTEGNYGIIINSGVFNINSTDDAIHSNSGDIIVNNGEFSITTFDDGLTADGLLQISNGNINISHCFEGLEGAQIEIEGGKIEVVSEDDGVNAASDLSNNLYILITGGELYINAAGDGLDSNGGVYIEGGAVYIDGPTGGADSALDSENGILITGGYLFSVGSLGMVETPATNSTQYVVSYASASNIASGTQISLTDSEGNAIFTFTNAKECQSIIISCPELEVGKTYKIYGGSNELETFTISSIITSIGSTNMPGMGGGFMPNGGMMRR